MLLSKEPRRGFLQWIGTKDVVIRVAWCLPRCWGEVQGPAMSNTTCPLCQLDDVLEHPDKLECMTCGHEWIVEVEESRVVKDAYGNALATGDVVAMVKDLKLEGSSQVLKVGTKSKPIRLVDGDHEITCKMDGISVGLKACFVKKVS